MKEKKPVPVWLTWIARLPWPIRRTLANRWTRIAEVRIFWADIVTPEIADASREPVKSSNRKSDPDAVREVSDRLKTTLASRWPHETVRSRVRLFAHEIGWSNTRAKDVYYGDHRVSIRAFEQDEINTWFDDQQQGANA